MPILNYTTKISVQKTVGEIHEILAKHGAKKVIFDYDEQGEILALLFSIETPVGIQGIRLPSNAQKVYTVLQRQKVKCDIEQAERVAWRIVKDWVEAQMAILESEMVEMDEIFLPYMVDQRGRTFFEAYRENQLMLEGEE